MKRIALLLLVATIGSAFYLLAWPTRVEPRVWTAPAASQLRGRYTRNDKLGDVQRLAVGAGHGPASIAVDAVGRVYAGYSDGRVIVMSRDGSGYTVLANTAGRPLGIAFGPNGGEVVADAVKGLLHIGAKPAASLLVDSADGIKFAFTTGVDGAKISRDLFFTDASSRFAYPDWRDDLIEHSANGRLLRYNADTGQTHALLKDLHFPAGVAVGPDDAYVLIAEAGSNRIVRYWLGGAKAGTHDLFVDNLPGFPVNISFNGSGRFWVALVGDRDSVLDKFSTSPFARRVIARLPALLWPRPLRQCLVVAFDPDGNPVANLQYDGAAGYGPITSVVEYGPWLWFGGVTENAIGRLPLNQVFPPAPAPPQGWKDAPAQARENAPSRPHDRDDD